MTDRKKIEEVLARLERAHKMGVSSAEAAPDSTSWGEGAVAIRALLADNDYFREMPSLAVYVQAQKDAQALAKVRVAMAKIADAAVVLDNGMFRIEGTGEYFDVAVTEDAVNEIREALEQAEAPDEGAPAASTEEPGEQVFYLEDGQWVLFQLFENDQPRLGKVQNLIMEVPYDRYRVTLWSPALGRLAKYPETWNRRFLRPATDEDLATFHVVEEAAPAAGTAKYAMPPESDGHEHLPIQHRDGKPPWCKECGLDAYFREPKSRFDR